MISFLRGSLLEIAEDTLIMDVQGVGYEIYVSSKTQKNMSLSETVQLWIYTHVREDALKLFGFSTLLEKKIFLAFIAINGIGPKMALILLSSAPSLSKLLEMIEEEDVNGLVRLPRVGKKSAQQIILSLKGKLKEGWITQSEEKLKERKSVTQALLSLGFRDGEIRRAMEQVEKGNSIEEELKQALSYLQPGK